jgi:hypothetical protein
MTIRISRDAQGKVTITDLATGRAETVMTDVARPAETLLKDNDALPAHMWSRLSA